ncbi:NAD-dependent epimerase/dehydratase family protein [Kineosporia rhizophila]|uniref:NAD-dependent epimerase/dehydratase family protein n=1 Tax=Kineosporia rhizophila TaxID=84633 RepID=UPI001E424115|nr:NAD-dependent epimerase/dehydratase family protein [Kineosporia rhizophila]
MTPKRRPRFVLGSAGQTGPGVIAVTGAAGPAGRALVRSLLRRMSDSPQTAPVRVIAVDTAERIERLTAPPAPRPTEPVRIADDGETEADVRDQAKDEAKDPAKGQAKDLAEGEARDQARDVEPAGIEPGLEYAAQTHTPDRGTPSLAPAEPEKEPADAGQGSASSVIDEPNATTDSSRPRRRSYLPAGLASTLTATRKEPKEEPQEEPAKPAKKDERPSFPELGIVPGTDTGVDWRPADISSPDVVAALDSADVVVHLSTADDLAQTVTGNSSDRRLRAVRAAQAVSMAAAAVGARRFVAVTSAMVLGARPDNPVPLEDDATCRADPDDGLVGDLLEVERVLERIPRVHPGLEFTLIRPAALVGPGVDTAVTRHFEAPRLLVLRGTGTRWQFCHVDDLAEAIWTVLANGISGALTAGADGSMDETQVEQISGMRRLEVPAGLAFSTAERLHRVGVLNTPASELAYVVHPWVIGSTGLLAAGWRPEHDNETCLKGLLDDQRRRRATPGWRVDRREAAAMGAAGAAVALLGTAAIVRQARSRQSKRRRSTLEG